MPTFGQRLAKCLRPVDWDGKSHGALPDPDQYFRGYLRFARLLLERYGARGRKLADFALDSTAREQAMLGMMAMHQGDRQYARRCYISSIRNRPRKLKTYLRLAWALLPVRVAETLSAMLSPRLRRSLSGPPFMREERLL